ncbi:hypothetical protein GCM10017608_14180 [Agromyces luteolus]|nr:hypothetical protein GCM10017608_14180 [Agromyces luteolus]
MAARVEYTEACQTMARTAWRKEHATRGLKTSDAVRTTIRVNREARVSDTIPGHGNVWSE